MAVFKVEISLDSDAMQSPYELPAVLRHLADALVFNGYERDAGRIIDANGNDVGQWEVAE